MANQTPEQIARDRIDRMLEKAGWAVMDIKTLDFSKSPGIALRELKAGAGRADYILFVNEEPCGVIEAKREDEAHRLSKHKKQVENYAKSKLGFGKNLDPKAIRFIYLSTGQLTTFSDLRDPEGLSSLAGRLNRLSHCMTDQEKDEFISLARNKPVERVVRELLDAVNPDKIEAMARRTFNVEAPAEPDEEQLDAARKELEKIAVSTFNGPLNTFIENVRRIHEQVIDHKNIDQVTYAGWDQTAAENARETVDDFKKYIEENRDEITALKIFYNTPYYGRRNVDV